MAAVPEVDIQGPFTDKTPGPSVIPEYDDCIDPSLLFTTLLDPGFDVDPTEAAPADVFGYSEYNASGGLNMPSSTDALAVRMAQLHEELLQVASLDLELSCFDSMSFNEVFSGDQVHTFCKAFSRKRHYQYPVVHWPTFNLETTSLPLLLAISLNGAAYSNYSSHVAGSRAKAQDFYLIADAYIFQQLERSINSNLREAEFEATVEILQAALLIVVLQICFDESRKGVIIFKRLPLLVFSLRHFGLTRMKHDDEEDWRTFIRQETLIRLSTWTFFMDSLLTLLCNRPPSMSHAETLGHLPCNQALWDAESEETFIQLRLETGHEFVCLGDLTVGLMQNEWPIEPVPPFDRLTLHHLNAVIVGEFAEDYGNSPMTNKIRVAVAGATGNTGSSIMNALLKSPERFEITVLVRPASIGKPELVEFAKQGVAVKSVDLDGSIDAISGTLANMDVVISCLTLLQFNEEMNLIEASSNANVGRFIPSFWGPACAPRGIMMIREMKEDLIDRIKGLYLPYTVIDVGWWYQLSLPALPSGRFRPAAEEYSTTRIIGDGNLPSALTDNRDIGRFVSRIIADPRTLNKMVFAYGDVITQNGAFELLEKVSGEAIPREFMTIEELHNIISEGRATAGKQDIKDVTVLPRIGAEYRNLLGIRGDNTPEYARYLGYLDARDLYPDMEVTTLENYIKRLVR
ncbi:isoflavone reductase [Colletotrichum gloeosporioides Cg-14]|uniref:Isoflavone reductase n=1 Tax=Colletotrichum gloeosporioides (strain Cg-14) TaxID=1237896 RepID=T0L772_COLGC|nr:isoflavone reductase [Colletotrichum gloeosporioides Cg-14]